MLVKNSLMSLDLDRAFAELEALARQMTRTAPVGGINVPVSMWREGEQLLIELDVPGVAEDDLELTVNDGRLIIQGERKPREGVTFAFNTRGFGKFEQVIGLPKDIDGESVQAELRHGVLTLRFSQRPEARPRKITLKPIAGPQTVESNGNSSSSGS